MSNIKKEQIKAYLENRLINGKKVLESMIVSSDGKVLPKRSAFLIINKYVREFNNKEADTRWILIPGLRGVGKTTLVAQLYNSIQCEDECKIYISLDDATRNLDANIGEILAVYEKELLGKSFEELNKPVYIFLDEVQYDESWGITLKNIWDRSKNVFIVCTGSSALAIQNNPDVSRRVATVKIYPLSFTEYQMIKNNRYPVRGLGSAIRNAIFGSNNAEDVYTSLKVLSPQVKRYWSKISKEEIDEYLKYGTLPSALTLSSVPLIYSQINQTLNNVLTKDVPQMDTFDKNTIDKLSQILYLISGADVTSFNVIGQTVGLNAKTIASIFEALSKTEMLIRVYPHGAQETQVRKPSKFLFFSPAYRAMYYNIVGSIFTFDQYKGKLMEDIIGLYLTRALSSTPGFSMTYDSAAGGADFIVDAGLPGLKKIVMEVGTGKKGYKQALQTMEKVSSRYGLSVSYQSLMLNEKKTVVSVPLTYFLLI